MEHLIKLDACINEHLDPGVNEYKDRVLHWNTLLAKYTSKTKPQPIHENYKQEMYTSLETLQQDLANSKQLLNNISTACTRASVELETLETRIPEIYRTINNHILSLGLQGLTKMDVRDYFMSHGHDIKNVPEGIMTYVVKRPFTYTPHKPIGGSKKHRKTRKTAHSKTK